MTPATDSASPSHPSGLGRPPERSASGSTVKIGLSAKMGPTIEMSPRALARARSPLMAITSTAEAAIAGQARPGATKAWPDRAKNAIQAANATACVHATMTSGGIARARPLTTANCAACVSAAARDSANQVRRRGRRLRETSNTEPG